MAPPKLPPRAPMKRFGALQLLAYVCPALVLWTHCGPEYVSHMIPIVLAFSYELARTRRSLSLGDTTLFFNEITRSQHELLETLSYLKEMDAAVEAVKSDIKLKKNAEFARKRAIKNPCTIPDCKNKATYAYRYGEADRCEAHCEDRKKQYKVCTCGKAQPSYNFPDETSAAYCATCKKPGMVNIVSKRCVCNSRQPCFNYPDDQTPVCCAKCMEPGMIHVGRVKCECGKSVPKYNEIGEPSPKYCGLCKTDTMVNVTGQMCVTCKVSYAAYNIPSERKVLYCGKCKLHGMEKVALRYCPGAEGTCMKQWNPKYRGYCVHCFVNTFPNDPMTFTIHRKSKENKVRDFINSTFEGFQHDVPLCTAHCDCTVRRRLDHYKIIGNTVLAIETDESQHKAYSQMDEEMRYHDLFMAFSGRWVYIRFNPDAYKTKSGAKRNPPMTDRFAALGEEIARQIARITERGDVALAPDADVNDEDYIERTYMYYDGYT